MVWGRSDGGLVGRALLILEARSVIIKFYLLTRVYTVTQKETRV